MPDAPIPPPDGVTGPWITEPGAYDLTDDQYHADPVVGGSLSSSGARTLLRASPARFDYERHNGGRADKDEFDFGRAVHLRVLGVGGAVVVVEGSGKDPNAWRTDDDRAAVAAARAAGATPIRPRDVPVVEAMAAALREHPVAGPLFDRPGRPETSYVGRDPETGIMCRARIDWLPDVADDERIIMVDYKSARTAEPGRFAKAAADHEYHMQGPFYGDVLSWLDLDHGQSPLFVLVAQEKDPPYLVSVGYPSGRAVEWGRIRNRKARDLYRQCVADGHWPGYTEAPVELDIPGWLDYQYTADYDAGRYALNGD
jgi:hypothetical protein